MRKQISGGIIATLTIIMTLFSPVLAELPQVVVWKKENMAIAAGVKGDRDDIIDGLVKAINEAGGTIADSNQLGSTQIISTDWFSMPHNVWAYDCRLSINISKADKPGYHIVYMRGNLRARINGKHEEDNEIRPFMRSLVKSMATGGWVDEGK